MYNYIDLNRFRADEIIMYLRKSRADDPMLSVEEVLSRHEEILDEFCEKHLGTKIPESNRYREVVSGESLSDRIAFQKVLKRIESPAVKAVLAVEVQRIGRPDLEEIGKITKILRYTETMVITPTKVFNITDEYDRDLFERELKRGNEYLEYVKKIMQRGTILSVSQGNYVASSPPFGYEKTFVMDGKRKCPTLTIKEDEANVVRMIYDMYVNQDIGRSHICYKLDELGIKSPSGKRWSPSMLIDILENEHYIGMVKWNRRKTIKVVEDGVIRTSAPKKKKGEYLLFEGKHPPIISKELFEAAQAKRGRNSRAKPKTKVRNPLAGLVQCHCGKAMTMRLYYNRQAKPRLLCDDQVHCHTGSCLYEEIEEMVCGILENTIADYQIKLEADNNDSILYHQKTIKNLEQRLKTIKEREILQWEAQSDPDPSKRMPSEIFYQLNAKLVKEKEEIEVALKNALDTLPSPVEYEKKIAMFSDALETLRNPDADASLKNRLLKACIDKIIYNRKKPERMKKQPGEKKGTTMKTTGGHWESFPIELEVKLRG